MKRFSKRLFEWLLSKRSPPKKDSYGLVFENYGDPVQMLSYKPVEEGIVDENQIRLQMLAAPIHPSDLNTIEGTYPLKPPMSSWCLPAFGGHEGVGAVLEIGSKVKNCAVGDWVVPLASHQGTWRESGIFESQFWHKIPQGISPETAACVTINPPTALCLLRDFVNLKSGDVVVQNGATSAVGQAVIQIAKIKNIQTINIIRNRPNLQHTVEMLKSMGATLVETDDKIQEMFKSSGLPLGSLGLNAIGGKQATIVSKLLKNRSTMVTYGGMSKQPFMMSTMALIFKEITYKGFWWSGYKSQQLGFTNKAKIIDEVIEWVLSGQLRIRTDPFQLIDYKQAIEKQTAPYKDSQVVFVNKMPR